MARDPSLRDSRSSVEAPPDRTTPDCISRGVVRIEWEDLGEGRSGDYDPADPEDERLLRFYVRRWDADAGEWEDVEDASYCTNFPATASAAEKQSALEYLMRQFRGPVEAGESVKKLGERMSWISPEWLKPEVPPAWATLAVTTPAAATPGQRVAQVLAQQHAEEFRAYVARYNTRHPEHQATVRTLALRFRLRQSDVARHIASAPGVGLVVSDMAYCRPADRTWGKIMVAAYHPQFAPDAPLGDHLVVFIGEGGEGENAGNSGSAGSD